MREGEGNTGSWESEEIPSLSHTNKNKTVMKRKGNLGAFEVHLDLSLSVTAVFHCAVQCL